MGFDARDYVEAAQPFDAVRRTSRPDATPHDDGRISVLVSLNNEPDGHWERFFDEGQTGVKARLIRRARDAHPGQLGQGTGIYFTISSADELREATHNIDELIAATNQQYLEVVVPAEEAKADADRRREEERAVKQAELDRIASDLLPPGGEEDPHQVRRPKTSRDW